MNEPRVLNLEFNGEEKDRAGFLWQIREKVIELTGETMTLDALINEMAKNIFDHVEGKGFIVIVSKGNSFKFVVKDYGRNSYNFEECLRTSKLAGNGVNHGHGLRIITDLAKDLDINLYVNTSGGFLYAGIYQKNKLSH